jgi:glycosyltransferase involved in cell wall biosynthesis
MMNAPLFSIVIPTYNRCDLVIHAVQSVVRQTFEDFEVIVCDNSSTDRTAEAIKEIADRRVRYVKTPRHLVIADNWEFARAKATGRLILMLGDDDALVPTALERFAVEHTTHQSDFMFCSTAEYRDRSFPGPMRNTLESPPFANISEIIQRDRFLNGFFGCRLEFDMHPSAFFFGKSLAESIAVRCGRFFQTNGVEYCAWPLAAAFASGIVRIDAPLSICGRTGKSWGSNLILANPGRKRIKQFIDDVEKQHRFAPLTNFTMCNLRAEGILTAQHLFPKEFAGYRFDEQRYLRHTMVELQGRQALGVDVSNQMEELIQYLTKYPDLKTTLLQGEQVVAKAREENIWIRLRGKLGDVGLRRVRDRVKTRREGRKRLAEDAQKVKQGDVCAGLKIAGADFEFYDILGAADFLRKIITCDTSRLAGALAEQEVGGSETPCGEKPLAPLMQRSIKEAT